MESHSHCWGSQCLEKRQLSPTGERTAASRSGLQGTEGGKVTRAHNRRRRFQAICRRFHQVWSFGLFSAFLLETIRKLSLFSLSFIFFWPLFVADGRTFLCVLLLGGSYSFSWMSLFVRGFVFLIILFVCFPFPSRGG